MRWLLALAFLTMPTVIYAQKTDATQPVTPPGAPAVTQDLVKLDFAGGTAADLVGALEPVLAERVVVRRTYARTLQPFKIPGPSPEGMGGDMLLSGIPDGPGFGGATADGVTPERLVLLLPPYCRIGLRPGWLLEPKAPADAAMGAIKPRKLIEKRDGEIIPFVRFEAITAGDLADQLFGHGRLPILTADGVTMPEAPFAIDLADVSVQAVIEALAAKADAQATPVWVAYDLTEDLQEYLEAVTDDEIGDMTKMLDAWAGLTDEQRQGIMAMIYGQFSQLPPEERQAMLAGMQAMLQGFAGRMGSMDPAMAGQVQGAMQGMANDFSTFYGGLNPTQRSELSGLFGSFNNLFGGGGGRRGGRPGQ
jgi:hypothetical protein